MIIDGVSSVLGLSSCGGSFTPIALAWSIRPGPTVLPRSRGNLPGCGPEGREFESRRARQSRT